VGQAGGSRKKSANSRGKTDCASTAKSRCGLLVASRTEPERRTTRQRLSTWMTDLLMSAAQDHTSGGSFWHAINATSAGQMSGRPAYRWPSYMPAPAAIREGEG